MVDFDRPLESDKTLRYGFPTRIVGRRMDHHGALNRDTRTSGSSPNLDLCTLLLDPLCCRCLPRANHRRNDS